MTTTENDAKSLADRVVGRLTKAEKAWSQTTLSARVALLRAPHLTVEQVDR